MADITPDSVITPNNMIAAARYLTARFFDLDTTALLSLDLDATEMDREAVGVDRRKPLQIGDSRYRLVPRNAQIRHLALPGGVLVGGHEESRHRLLLAVGPGDCDPGVPGRIQPSLRQIGRVVRTVSHEGMTIDAGSALDHELTQLDHGSGLAVAQRFATQRLLFAY